MSKLIKNDYNPDILETIANLSNDEVFTPPDLARDMLDMLPGEIWSDSTITFLDPAVKTGIFLREVTSRLIDGLADEIPDLQERVNHILTKQVFGLGITELTTLMSRRTVYCSTTANGKYSVCTEFDDEKGNILFPDTNHTFDDNGRCEFCGANQDNYSKQDDKENYAYPFIHDNFEEVFDGMKFDVIIGNPPYQLSFGNKGANSAGANAIYHKFIDKSLELKPKYISMIIPSRWMSKTASGIPSEWVDKMIKDKRIKEIHDFFNSEDIFNNVVIRGGVNYFLWDSTYSGKCDFYQHSENIDPIVNAGYLDSTKAGVIVRDINALSVIEKVSEVEDYYLSNTLNNFSSMVSPGKFFVSGKKLQSNWNGFSEYKTEEYNIRYHMSSFMSGLDTGWVKESDVVKNKDTIGMHKIYINSAGHNEKFGPVLGVPTYGEPNSVCSETYLVIGYDRERHSFTKKECFNIISYIKTKFFRFMVDIKKTTQHSTRSAYQFVPLQDFSKSWTDDELYKKYKLTKEEIAYIEDNIEPME